MFDFFESIAQFIFVDAYIMLSDFATYALVKFSVAFINTKIWFIEVSFSVAFDVLDTLDISGTIQNSIDTAPNNIQQMLYFFRLPEVITNLLSGFVGRYVMRFIA